MGKVKFVVVARGLEVFCFYSLLHEMGGWVRVKDVTFPKKCLKKCQPEPKYRRSFLSSCTTLTRMTASLTATTVFQKYVSK